MKSQFVIANYAVAYFQSIKSFVIEKEFPVASSVSLWVRGAVLQNWLSGISPESTGACPSSPMELSGTLAVN